MAENEKGRQLRGPYFGGSAVKSWRSGQSDWLSDSSYVPSWSVVVFQAYLPTTKLIDGIPSCKHDKEPNYDQGVYASNHHAETNISRDALRREPDLLAEHCISDAIAQPNNITRHSGIRSGPNVQK